MTKLPRQSFTAEFREQAVKMIADEQLTIPEAARRLGLSVKTLGNWVQRSRRGQLSPVGEGRQAVTAEHAELSRLRRELAEAKLERDLLKNRPREPARARMHRNRLGLH